MIESIYSLKIIEQNSCCILSNIVKDIEGRVGDACN